MRFRSVVILRGRTVVISKKYVGNYRLENVPDRRGKLKTVPVYRGPLFRFTAEEGTLKKAKKRFLLLIALITAALLATMLLQADVLSRIYVVMPLVLCFLPTVLLWLGIHDLHYAGDSLQRDQSDRINNRFSGWSIVLSALAFLSLIGQVAAYIGGADLSNVPVTLCTVIVSVCAFLVFRGKKDLRVEMIPSDQ